MKTQHYAACSLDGFITDPDHSLGRHFQFGDTEGTGFPDFIRDVGAVAMGTSTYEWILRHQVHSDPDNPQPWPYKQPTWVFTSRALTVIRNADIKFVSGDVRFVYQQHGQSRR